MNDGWITLRQQKPDPVSVEAENQFPAESGTVETQRSDGGANAVVVAAVVER